MRVLLLILGLCATAQAVTLSRAARQQLGVAQLAPPVALHEDVLPVALATPIAVIIERLAVFANWRPWYVQGQLDLATARSLAVTLPGYDLGTALKLAAINPADFYPGNVIAVRARLAQLRVAKEGYTPALTAEVTALETLMRTHAATVPGDGLGKTTPLAP